MLPQRNDVPIPAFILGPDRTVSFHVPLDLWNPVFLSRFGSTEMHGTLVPEAGIKEYDDTATRERDIRGAEPLRMCHELKPR